ncbi:MAG: amidohydrolase [Erysipelotrichaceae bacterium]|nr:amidohydrolase [Erysipelotrichaceae bacterium]
MKKLDEEKIIALGQNLFKHPELGYKEFETKKIITDYLKSEGLSIGDECFETAFSVSIGSGHPHIGLIAELDAIPTLGHKCANKKDNNAAHACGHSTQCAIMCGVISALNKEKFKGKVTLFFTPAEEYTDIKYREQLIKEKKIKYIGGKLNLLEKGLFDDVDIFIHLHAMGENQYRFSLNTDLGGFIYKRITFKGRAAHAAVTPDKGINALNAYALFNSALNMLRETFKEKDTIRIHGFISEGGQTVNSIPERVVYECYVRSMNAEALIETAKKVDNAAVYCAKALGAKAEIKNKPGYLPLIQNREISKFIEKEMLKVTGKEEIENEVPSMAAGDVGDISIFKPVVQIGYGGFSGIPHGKNFMIKDENLIYIDTTKVLVNSVVSLLKKPETIEKIVKEYKPRMTKEDYLAYINNYE